MSFYPINPDTVVESFILTNPTRVKTDLGQAYSIKDLVPLNYQKLLIAAATEIPVPLAFIPIREYEYISTDNYKPDEISEEKFNFLQSSSLLIAFQQLIGYWDNQLLNNFEIPLGVVTEIKTDIIANPTGTAQVEGNRFNIKHKMKIEWFTIPGTTWA